MPEHSRWNNNIHQNLFRLQVLHDTTRRFAKLIFFINSTVDCNRILFQKFCLEDCKRIIGLSYSFRRVQPVKNIVQRIPSCWLWSFGKWNYCFDIRDYCFVCQKWLISFLLALTKMSVRICFFPFFLHQLKFPNTFRIDSKTKTVTAFIDKESDWLELSTSWRKYAV